MGQSWHGIEVASTPMSIPITNAAVECDQFKGNTRMLLIVLAFNAYDKGPYPRGFPDPGFGWMYRGEEWMMEQINVTRRQTVTDALDELLTAGAIKRKRRWHNTTLTFVDIDWLKAHARTQGTENVASVVKGVTSKLVAAEQDDAGEAFETDEVSDEVTHDVVTPAAQPPTPAAQLRTDVANPVVSEGSGNVPVTLRERTQNALYNDSGNGKRGVCGNEKRGKMLPRETLAFTTENVARSTSPVQRSSANSSSDTNTLTASQILPEAEPTAKAKPTTGAVIDRKRIQAAQVGSVSDPLPIPPAPLPAKLSPEEERQKRIDEKLEKIKHCHHHGELARTPFCYGCFPDTGSSWAREEPTEEELQEEFEL
jgi:hypothetical protein